MKWSINNTFLNYLKKNGNKFLINVVENNAINYFVKTNNDKKIKQQKRQAKNVNIIFLYPFTKIKFQFLRRSLRIKQFFK